MVRKMDEKLFKAIKIMTAGGATIPEISEYFDVSPATCSRVRAAESFQEYKNMMAAMACKRKPQEKAEKPQEQPEEKPQEPQEPPVQVVEHRQNVTLHATHYMECELKKQTEILELISRKLSFIVDQLS